LKNMALYGVESCMCRMEARVLHMSYWKNPNEFLMQNSYKYTFCYYVNLW